MYYFITEQHEQNYAELMVFYGLEPLERMQEEAAIYIAAIEDLYDLIGEPKDKYGCPLFELMEWNEKEEKHEPAHGGLTGTSRRLLEVGLSLYNGYPIGLDEVLGSVTSREYIEALIQAIKIRSHRSFY